MSDRVTGDVAEMTRQWSAMVERIEELEGRLSAARALLLEAKREHAHCGWCGGNCDKACNANCECTCGTTEWNARIDAEVGK